MMVAAVVVVVVVVAVVAGVFHLSRLVTTLGNLRSAETLLELLRHRRRALRIPLERR